MVGLVPRLERLVSLDRAASSYLLGCCFVVILVLVRLQDGARELVEVALDLILYQTHRL